MKVRTSAVVVALALLAGLAGCSKDKEVNGVLDEVEDFTKALVSKVDKAKDPKKGVEDALEYLEENGDDVKEKLESIKEVSEFQVNDETMERMMDVFLGSYGKLAELEIKYMDVEDEDFKKNLEKLSKGYNELFDI